MVADLWAYMKLVFAKPITSTVSVIALLLAIYNGVRPPSKPAVLPIWLWIAVAVASLIVAQFVVWRDSRALPVSTQHEQRLRVMAGKLKAHVDGNAMPVYTDGTSGASILKEMFAAHFPKTVKRIENADKARRRIEEADKALQAAIASSAREEFRQEDGWYVVPLINRATVERHQLLFQPGQADIAVQANDTAVVWRTDVLQFGEDRQALSDARDQVVSWTKNVFDSDAAAEYRKAVSERERPKTDAMAALDPIIHDAPISKSRACPICFPPDA